MSYEIVLFAIAGTCIGFAAIVLGINALATYLHKSSLRVRESQLDIHQHDVKRLRAEIDYWQQLCYAIALKHANAMREISAKRRDELPRLIAQEFDAEVLPMFRKRQMNWARANHGVFCANKRGES